MKIFRKVVLAIIILIGLLVIISFFLPMTYHVERSATMRADKFLVYDLASNLQKWDVWTPWTKKLDSTAVFELNGPDGKIGTIRKWEGKVVGNGQMTLTELKPGELVGYDLSFQKGKYNSKGKVIIEPSGDSLKVTWTDDGDLGYNPLSRYMGLFMGKMLGPQFELGLSKLKKIAEERRNWPKMSEKVIPAQVVLFIRDSAGPKTYAEVLGKGYGEIMKYVKSAKLTPAGPPFAVYLKWDSVTYFAVMDLGIPVLKAEKGMGRIRVENMPAQNAVVANYFGPYDKTSDAYKALDQYCRESGKTEAGGPWEIYVTDPTVEKDPMKVQTDIVFPVK